MTNNRKTWSIYADFSGVTQIECGGFYTRREALEDLIGRLEALKGDTQQKLTRARRALSREKRLASNEGGVR